MKKNTSYIFVFTTLFLVVQLVPGCAGMYDGKELFFTVGCSQCHSLNGRGGRMGPDLTAVANRRSTSWIVQYIKNPQKMNPMARMPSFQNLSKAKRRAIANYLSN